MRWLPARRATPDPDHALCVPPPNFCALPPVGGSPGHAAHPPDAWSGWTRRRAMSVPPPGAWLTAASFLSIVALGRQQGRLRKVAARLLMVSSSLRLTALPEPGSLLRRPEIPD